MACWSNKICLGTAQFGDTAYGISSEGDPVSDQELAKILGLAQRRKIDTLDTASLYGNAEKRLGQVGIEGFKVMSKLAGLPAELTISDVGNWFDSQLSESLENLKRSHVDAYLLHRPNELLSERGKVLLDCLLRARDDGRIKKMGVSVYSPDQLESMVSLANWDIVQAPLNLVDQRMISITPQKMLKQHGLEFHARSAFLQGLLLMRSEERPAYFSSKRRWRELFMAWDAYLNSVRGIRPNQTSPVAIAACLQFVLQQALVSKLVLGVHNAVQLDELLLGGDESDWAGIPFPAINSEDSDLVDPSRWPRA